MQVKFSYSVGKATFESTVDVSEWNDYEPEEKYQILFDAVMEEVEDKIEIHMDGISVEEDDED